MKLPRLSIKRMMILVAIFGVVFGLFIERRNRFQKIAAYHEAERDRLNSQLPDFMSAGSCEHPVMLRYEYHHGMLLKYEEAALHPWLLVKPDPPEPK